MKPEDTDEVPPTYTLELLSLFAFDFGTDDEFDGMEARLIPKKQMSATDVPTVSTHTRSSSTYCTVETYLNRLLLLQVKAKKKRKIHHVKAQQKDERVEEDALKKASGWQKFMQKNGKQKGFIKSGGAKQSIFASADKGLAAGGGPASSSSMARPASAAPGAFFRR